MDRMKPHWLLSLMLYPVLVLLIFLLAPIWGLIIVYLLDHPIIKVYYQLRRKLRRYLT